MILLAGAGICTYQGDRKREKQTHTQHTNINQKIAAVDFAELLPFLRTLVIRGHLLGTRVAEHTRSRRTGDAGICTYQGDRKKKETNTQHTNINQKIVAVELLPFLRTLATRVIPWMLEAPNTHEAGVLTMLASSRTKETEKERNKHTQHTNINKKILDVDTTELLLCLLTLTTRGHPLDARVTKHMHRVAFLPIWTFLLLPFFLLLCTHNTRTSTKRLWL